MTETAVSLKPTLLLALCPHSSFPFSHPATWAELHCTEGTNFTLHSQTVSPTISPTLAPFRTRVTDWGLFHLLWRTRTSEQSSHTFLRPRTRQGMITTQVSASQTHSYWHFRLDCTVGLLCFIVWSVKYWFADSLTGCQLTLCMRWVWCWKLLPTVQELLSSPVSGNQIIVALEQWCLSLKLLCSVRF